MDSFAASYRKKRISPAMPATGTAHENRENWRYPISAVSSSAMLAAAPQNLAEGISFKIDHQATAKMIASMGKIITASALSMKCDL
jgi:hypothetical protein